ncbi:MAG: phosphoenolpyruvate--protein phosphotransferase [Alphaproteobacteria bacterium]|nr:phosphoenolpyruvate--protein phosphotransferase [Alphaproteobacteria bacterium]
MSRMRNKKISTVKNPFRKEKIFKGLGVSPGVAVGPAHVREFGNTEIPRYQIKNSKVASELKRFVSSVKKAKDQLINLKKKSKTLPEATAEELGYLMDAHLHMLEGSRLLRGVERRITKNLVNAESAVQDEILETAKSFSVMKDTYLSARMDDINEVGARLIRCLTKVTFTPFSNLQKNTIIIAEEITPADTALIDPKKVSGFATMLGGAEGHTAIMARSLILPAVLGITSLKPIIREGDIVIVDGDLGYLIVHPKRSTLAKYGKKQNLIQKRTKDLVRIRKLPSRTIDGLEISLLANIELPRETKNVLQNGAAGIGLVRSEFMYMNRDDLPTEEEQYKFLTSIVKSMRGKLVTIRTLDVGGEKLATSLGGHLQPSPNPALGLRAVRLSLKFPDLLKTQLAAILRANAHGPVRILIPMISSPEEIIEVKKIMIEVEKKLRKKGIKIGPKTPPLGAMIETPAAAMSADHLSGVCDFFAIGTNDLTMYTLAIDRGDDQVAEMYNAIHPSILRLIQFSVQSALRSGMSMSICGEVAGDERYTALMIGLGVRELSMAPASLLRVRERIRCVNADATRKLAQSVMEETNSVRMNNLIDKFNSKLF